MDKDIDKPPDSQNYRTIKTSLRSIVKVKHGIPEDLSPIHNAIKRTHRLTILAYQFVRLFILHCYDKKHQIPLIDEKFLTVALGCLSQVNNPGAPYQGESQMLQIRLKFFYDTQFKVLLGNQQKINADNLSHVLGYLKTQMVTCIENNIKENFENHLNRFVNQSFKKENDVFLDSLNLSAGSERDKEKKKLYTALKLVKEDFLNQTLTSDPKFHPFILSHRSLILPDPLPKISHLVHLKSCPQKFLKSLIFMNASLENQGLKQFQFFPLRSSGAPSYIQIDTTVLRDLYPNRRGIGSVNSIKEEIWKSLFKIDSKSFRQNGFQFDYTILTDGVGASIRFASDKQSILNEKRKKKAKNAQKDAALANKDLSKIKRTQKRQEIQERKMAIRIAKVEENDRKLEDLKKKWSTMSAEEQNKYKEFPYFNLLDSEEKKKLRNAKKVYVDPGKRDIYTMVDDENRIYRYSNRKRLNETKRIKYQEIVEARKAELGIIKEEQELNNLNQKTCNYLKFQEYIRKKTLVNSKVLSLYEDPLFRKLNWYSYINNQKADFKLLKEIESFYGYDSSGKKIKKKIALIMGDWSDNGRIKYMSTPGIRLKRLLSKKFWVLNVNEHRTSCLNHLTEELMEKIYLKHKDGKTRKMHAILTYKRKNRNVYINRDRNAVFNMRKIVHEEIRTGKRPYNYCKGNQLRKKKTYPKITLKNPQTVVTIKHAKLPVICLSETDEDRKIKILPAQVDPQLKVFGWDMGERGGQPTSSMEKQFSPILSAKSDNSP